MATKYLLSHIQNHLPSTSIIIFHRTTYIVNDYQEHLRQLCHYTDIKKFIKDKHMRSEKNIQDIA